MIKIKGSSVILIICIIVLMILNVVLSFRLKSIKSYVISENKACLGQLDRLQRDYRVLLTNQFHQYESEGSILIDFYLREIEVRDSFPVSSVIDDKNILFLRFKETNCDACVNRFMEFLKGIPNNFPVQNMVILCGYTNVHEYRTFVRKNKLRIPVFNIESISALSVDCQENPYFFVLGSDLRIKNIFIPDVHQTKHLNRYLNFVKNKYWTL